jgi:hypothetical protein
VGLFSFSVVQERKHGLTHATKEKQTTWDCGVQVGPTHGFAFDFFSVERHARQAVLPARGRGRGRGFGLGSEAWRVLEMATSARLLLQGPRAGPLPLGAGRGGSAGADRRTRRAGCAGRLPRRLAAGASTMGTQRGAWKRGRRRGFLTCARQTTDQARKEDGDFGRMLRGVRTQAPTARTSMARRGCCLTRQTASRSLGGYRREIWGAMCFASWPWVESWGRRIGGGAVGRWRAGGRGMAREWLACAARRASSQPSSTRASASPRVGWLLLACGWAEGGARPLGRASAGKQGGPRACRGEGNGLVCR